MITSLLALKKSSSYPKEELSEKDDNRDISDMMLNTKEGIEYHSTDL